MRKPFLCCVCKKPIGNEYGNNPWPVCYQGRCCDICNDTKVIPSRLNKLKKSK